MAAADLAPQDLVNCIDGYVEVSRRLVQDFGFELHFGSLGADIGEYDGDHRIVTINAVAPLQDQLWFLIQAWQLCAIGPHAVPFATREQRTLRLVRG